jgi:hypothetical protein
MIKIIFYFLISCFYTSLFAQECHEVTPIRWLIKEVEEVHPGLLLKRLSLDQTMAREHDAKKFINPELEHFSVAGREFEPKKVYMNETRLWFTLQLAGKRQGKIQEWERAVELENYEAYLLKQAVLKDLWINFFRLHQIHEEIKIKSRIISKLENILEQYQKRRALSPDQMMEERIIKMVVDNFELSSNVLSREKLSIFEFLKEVTGHQCQIKQISSEEDSIKWPNANDVKSRTTEQLILSKLASLELSLSKAQESLADKKATPDIRIAPLIQNYQTGDMDVYTGGISFVFPLAIFDRNQSERLQSKLLSGWSERRVELEKKKENQQIIFRLEKYESGLSVLKEVDVIEQSLKRFDSVQVWFKEGKISIANIVEFCRQLDEITKNYHHGENMLMSDLLGIYELRGSITSENLLKLI